MEAPRLRILALDLFERNVVLRLPFRFGVVTLTACPQAFVRARIAVEDGVEAVGASAELLAPKWFDKNLALTNEDNFRQLRDSLRLAREAYLADTRSRCAFRYAASCYQALIDSGSLRGLNPLVVGFGPALTDFSEAAGNCRTSTSATPWGWSIRSPQATPPRVSMTACRKRWRKSSRFTPTATSSSRSAATPTPTSRV